VSSDGVVRAGFTLANSPIKDATSISSALAMPDGSVLLGTSPSGKVIKVVGDQASVFCETKSLDVTGLSFGPGGAVYASTLPDGKIFKIAQGKADVFATLPDMNNVFAIATDKSRSAIFAAGGTEGRVFRVGADGTPSVYFKSDEPYIVSLAVADNGDVYAGSSGGALLYKITGPGRASVLYDFPGEDVKAIAITKNGYIYAISNEHGEPVEPPRRSANAGRTPAAPVTIVRSKPGKGTLTRFDPQGRPERMMHHDDFDYRSLALDENDQPYVGTNTEGRVYTVNDAHVVTLVADVDERQVNALAVTSKNAFVAGSDPAVFHRVIARGGNDAVWTSKVLDAGLRAKFGQINWRATGALEMSTRTGNTAQPDVTWSAWSAPVAASSVIPSPQGRFVQVRARWGRDPNAILSEVIIPFITENVRPIVLEVNAQPKNAPAKEPRSDNLPPSGNEPPKHDPIVKVTWRVDDPDNDQLRYRVSFKREGSTLWRDAERADDVLTKPEYEWDTIAVPEGKYRVRVENPPNETQRHSLESPPVVVDNTPPVISAFTVTGRRLHAHITDGLGPVARVEIAIDGRLEWRPLAAADGVFDSAAESVDTDVTALVPPGAHIVAIRAFDAAGNSTTSEVETR
jgi:hypothetical protein